MCTSVVRNFIRSLVLNNHLFYTILFLLFQHNLYSIQTLNRNRRILYFADVSISLTTIIQPTHEQMPFCIYADI